MSVNPEPMYCCTFRIGNIPDLIDDHGIAGHSLIVSNILENIYIELGVDIFKHSLMDKDYYYCYLNMQKLSKFRSQVYKYRGTGIIILYGTYMYFPPLSVHVVGGQDIILVNLLLSSIIQLNRHTSDIKPVRRIRVVEGQVQIYESYVN